MLHIEKQEGIYTNKYNRPKNKKSKTLSEHKITNIMVAKWFDYVSDDSFNSSSAKERILKGVDRVVQYVEEYNRKK